MNNAIFYHAGCPVCVSAEQQILDALDKSRVAIEVVHLGEESTKLKQAKEAGVVSVPALVLDDQVFHINFGASLDELVEGES